MEAVDLRAMFKFKLLQLLYGVDHLRVRFSV